MAERERKTPTTKVMSVRLPHATYVKLEAIRVRRGYINQQDNLKAAIDLWIGNHLTPQPKGGKRGV